MSAHPKKTGKSLKSAHFCRKFLETITVSFKHRFFGLFSVSYIVSQQKLNSFAVRFQRLEVRGFKGREQK